VFHHILRACADEQLVRALASQYRSAFDTSNFQNELPEGFAYVSFVRTYGAYLTAWGVLKARLDYPPCKTGVWADKPESEFCETLERTEPKVLLNGLSFFLDLLAQMGKLELDGPIRSSQVGTAAIGLIIKDFEHTWISAQRGFVVLVDAFFGPSPDSVAPRGSAAAKKLLALYDRFTGESAKQVSELVALLTSAKPSWRPPIIDQPDEYAVRDILDAMDAHAHPGAGGVGRVAPVVQAGADMYGDSRARGGDRRGASGGAAAGAAAGGGGGFFGGDEDPFAPVENKSRSGKKSGSRDRQSDDQVHDKPAFSSSGDPFEGASDGLDSLLLAPPAASGNQGSARGGADGLGRDPFAPQSGQMDQQFMMPQQLAIPGQQQQMQMMQQAQYAQAMAARQQQMQLMQQRQLMQMQAMRQQQLLQQQALQLQQQQQQLQQQQQKLQQQAQATKQASARPSYNAAAYGNRGESYNAAAYGNRSTGYDAGYRNNDGYY